jgi:hypothetical protein
MRFPVKFVIFIYLLFLHIWYSLIDCIKSASAFFWVYSLNTFLQIVSYRMFFDDSSELQRKGRWESNINVLFGISFTLKENKIDYKD